MKFKMGDPVMHWMYGFGRVIGVEERAISGQSILYYAISIRDLTVWVPADEQLEARLRHPTPRERFTALFAILTDSGEQLPSDRQERKLWLVEKLKDGQAASLFHVIRDLTTFQQAHPLNDHDQNTLRRTREALLGEWIYTLAVPGIEAESELHRMLANGTARVAKA